MSEPWKCVCGETDIEKHDLGTAIAHIYGLLEQEGRDVLVGMRDRVGLETLPDDRTVSGGDTE